MEDRIIGPLTMLQFVYAVVGGGTCYTLFLKVPPPISFFLIIPVAILTFAIIFLKVNERPFLHFVRSVFEFMSNPKQRVWQHDAGGLTIETYQPMQKTGPVIQSKKFSREDIRKLANTLDNKSLNNS